MKKSTWLCLVLCLAALCLALTASADMFEDWTFTVTNGEAIILNCDPAAGGEVVLPASIDGCPVTTVMAAAFKGCDKVTSVVIPASVKRIDEAAFSGCSNLLSIKVDADNPNYASDVQGVLYNRFGTTLIRCPLGRTSCSIGTSVNMIGWGAFEDCRLIESLVLPSSVEWIENDAFYGCDNLQSITIPDSVTYIGGGAFTGCTKMMHKVDGLVYLQTTDNPYYYLMYAESTSMIDAPIHKRCKFIGRGVFEGCENLTDVIIPAAVHSIGDAAFLDCPALRTLTFAETSACKAIGAYAFGGCDALSDIYYMGTEAEWHTVAMGTGIIEYGGRNMNNEALSRATVHFAYPLKHADRTDAIVLAVGKLRAWVFGDEMLNDVAPKIVNDRTMVPVRFIAEALGATVDWNFEGAARKAVVQKGRTTVEIMIGSPVAYVNGVEVALDSPAFIENDRTYLPLRFVVESLGAGVTWDGDVGEIIITG